MQTDTATDRDERDHGVACDAADRRRYSTYVSASDGHIVCWLRVGTLQDDGWIEVGDTRVRPTEKWHETRAAAICSMADQVDDMAAKFQQQAQDLREGRCQPSVL